MYDVRRSMLMPLFLVLAASGCGGDDADRDSGSPIADAPAARAAGGDAAAEEAEEAELAAYRLEIGEVRKWAAVLASPEYAALNAETEVSGGAGDGGDEEDEDDDYGDGDDDNPSLDQIEAQLERNPRARALIENAGLDVRDFVLITFAMMQVGVLQHAMDQGADADSAAVELDISPDKMEFLREHRAELDAMRNAPSSGGR